MSSISNDPFKSFLDKVLGGQKLGERLGKGVSGEVYPVLSDKGEVTELIAKVYNDNIHPKDIGNEFEILEFLKKTPCPNLCEPVGNFSFNKKIFISLQKDAGINLYEKYIRKGIKVSLKTIRRIAEQALTALSYLHKNGIYHLDVAPENLCMDKNENVRLIDFGLSQRKDNKNKGTFCRNLYRPQENYVYGTKGPFTDIWALGSVLFELFTNKAFIQPEKSTLTGIFRALCHIWFRLGGNDESFRENLSFLPERIRKIYDLTPRMMNLEKSYRREIEGRIEVKKDVSLLDEGIFKCFLRQMLRWNPKNRASAQDLLKHPFLKPDWASFNGVRFSVAFNKASQGMQLNIFCKKDIALLSSRILDKSPTQFKLPKPLSPFTFRLLHEDGTLCQQYSYSPEEKDVFEFDIREDGDASSETEQSPLSLQEEKSEVA